MTMINKDTIKKLAELSRIELSEKEINGIQKDLGGVLEYVSHLKDVKTGEASEENEHINIFREDVEPHKSGEHTEALLAEASKTKDGYVVVKQVMVEKKRITN